jgi:hypothetical protein
MIRELLQKVLLKLSVFLNVQTSKTESYIYTTDTTINIFDVKSILFVNKDDEYNKVFINNLPLDYNDSLTYNADSRSTITDNFNITFESTSGRLFVTIIR